MFLLSELKEKIYAYLKAKKYDNDGSKESKVTTIIDLLESVKKKKSETKELKTVQT